MKKPTHLQSFERHEEFHVVLTSFITWTLAVFMWLPYVIVGFVHAYEDPGDPAWEGWYPLAVMFAHLSYMLKPVVYLSHNKPIRKHVRALFPKATQKLYETQRVLNERTEAVDAFLFNQPDRLVSLDFWKKPKLGNLMEVKLAVGNWKDTRLRFKGINISLS